MGEIKLLDDEHEESSKNIFWLFTERGLFYTPATFGLIIFKFFEMIIQSVHQTFINFIDFLVNLSLSSQLTFDK